jgi:hypothetical protein
MQDQEKFGNTASVLKQYFCLLQDKVLTGRGDKGKAATAT